MIAKALSVNDFIYRLDLIKNSLSSFVYLLIKKKEEKIAKQQKIIEKKIVH